MRTLFSCLIVLVVGCSESPVTCPEPDAGGDGGGGTVTFLVSEQPVYSSAVEAECDDLGGVPITSATDVGGALVACREDPERQHCWVYMGNEWPGGLPWALSPTQVMFRVQGGELRAHAVCVVR